MNGLLRLDHKCQWVEERVEEELLPVCLRWRRDRERVGGLEDGRGVHQFLGETKPRLHEVYAASWREGQRGEREERGIERRERGRKERREATNIDQ